MRPTEIITLAVLAMASVVKANRHDSKPDYVPENCWYECDDRCFRHFAITRLDPYKACMPECIKHRALNGVCDIDFERMCKHPDMKSNIVCGGSE